jgi:hypothetical protein
MFSGSPILAMRMLVVRVAVRFDGREPPFQSMGDRDLSKLPSLLESFQLAEPLLDRIPTVPDLLGLLFGLSQERVFAETVVSFPSLNRCRYFADLQLLHYDSPFLEQSAEWRVWTESVWFRADEIIHDSQVQVGAIHTIHRYATARFLTCDSSTLRTFGRGQLPGRIIAVIRSGATQSFHRS